MGGGRKEEISTAAEIATERRRSPSVREKTSPVNVHSSEEFGPLGLCFGPGRCPVASYSTSMMRAPSRRSCAANSRGFAKASAVEPAQQAFFVASYFIVSWF